VQQSQPCLGGHLTCKDSLLTGWDEGTDQSSHSSPVASTFSKETRLDLER
jgi:hypothetical protein